MLHSLYAKCVQFVSSGFIPAKCTTNVMVALRLLVKKYRKGLVASCVCPYCISRESLRYDLKREAVIQVDEVVSGRQVCIEETMDGYGRWVCQGSALHPHLTENKV